jgi:hypothetical protein
MPGTIQQPLTRRVPYNCRYRRRSVALQWSHRPFESQYWHDGSKESPSARANVALTVLCPYSADLSGDRLASGLDVDSQAELRSGR